MKKVLLLIILFFSLFLTGCGGFQSTVEARENSITLTLDDDYRQFTEGEIPSFTFNFDGTLNVIANNPNKFYVQFSNNEDKILSDALGKLFEQYKDIQKESKTSEYYRLLYVAMTRARDELYIYGHTTNKNAPEKSWHTQLWQILGNDSSEQFIRITNDNIK